MGYDVLTSWLCHIFAIRFIAVLVSGLGLAASTLVTSALATDLEQHVHRMVNEHRVSQGLKPLTFNPKIAAIARRHSQDMATGRVGFSHGGFESRREKIAGFIAQPWVGENVAANNGDFLYAGEEAVSGWLQSPGHRRNIEGAYDLTGVGIAQGPAGEYYFTQLFVRAKSNHPGTSGSDTPYTRPVPAPRDRKSESRVVETRPPSDYNRPLGRVIS